ncbi:MAG: efflux RND transporter periplasmic adaptor subunit [Aquabacterium sp.]|jgi:membrane fusion protein (multidrug efflux system)|nr:MAG: efflux RND transporter periplasmic adaptor subunit [Aquabacterium sp.]
MSKPLLRWGVGLLVLALVAGGLYKRAATKKAAAAAAATAASQPSALELAPGDVLVARSQSFNRGVPVSGGLKAARSAVVKARVAGELATLTVREGDAVREGQVIGRIDEREYRMRLEQAQQQAASAQAQLDIAQRTLSNNRALVDQGFISKNALDTSDSNTQAARANLQAAKTAADLARKSLDDAVLRAPIAGFVSQRFAQAGERVSIDGRVVEIVDLSRIELEAALTPQDVAEVRTGMHASLQVDGLAQPVDATVARINPSAQAGTRAVLVYLALKPHPALRQGLFARGRIDVASQRALAVPQGAVRNDQARPYVLLLKDGQVLRRPVTLGRGGTVGRDAVVEVTSGLAEGERILAGSAGLLPEGTRVAVPASAGASAASR